MKHQKSRDKADLEGVEPSSKCASSQWLQRQRLTHWAAGPSTQELWVSIIHMNEVAASLKQGLKSLPFKFEFLTGLCLSNLDF